MRTVSIPDMDGAVVTQALPVQECRQCHEVRTMARPRGRLCAPCAEANKHRRHEGDNVRRVNLAKYRLTLEQYDEMRAAQGYRCAICQRHEAELPRSTSGRPRKDGSPSKASALLVVDHDHVTGVVRGLLCATCNIALGMFADHPGSLENAVRYLSAPPGTPPEDPMWTEIDAAKAKAADERVRWAHRRASGVRR
jgi:hypothetical protein